LSESGQACCRADRHHRRAVIGGALLFALATYVVIAAAWNLWTQHHEEFSVAGFVVTLMAIPIMQYLAARKIDVTKQLGSRALRTDAVESITCGWLSLLTAISLAAQATTGVWWIDSVGFARDRLVPGQGRS
jgi:divalent metal cation (Fe/Co/Zn/Cd) transporter